MSPEASSDEVEPTTSAEPPLRGSILDVLGTLLGEHQERDTVLAIVGKLVARNTDLERRIARMAARFKPSEQVSRAQLVLFLDALKRGEGKRRRYPTASSPMITPRSSPPMTSCVQRPESTRARTTTSASCARRHRLDSRGHLRRPRTCRGSTIRSRSPPRSGPVRSAAQIARASSRTSPR